MKRINQLNSLFLGQFYVFELILTLKKSQNFNFSRYFGIPKNVSIFVVYTIRLFLSILNNFLKMQILPFQVCQLEALKGSESNETFHIG
jgi:hypothetical protein